MFSYDTSNPVIEYHSNMEYRQVLRLLFKMNCFEIEMELRKTYKDTLDTETFDELLIDTKKMETILDKLFIETKDHQLFQQLYDLAAAKMLSVDRQIGQSILFSYDYLYLFHACICVFLNSPSEFTDQCSYYIQLHAKLLKR